ncbi:MAG: VWA domain-containing protein [Alphaproteobacteria bacterium]
MDRRDFANLDDKVELNTRNISVALCRLRRFAREGAADELDLDGTIRKTAKQGWLDIEMRPERHNHVKVLIFFDVGGSMSPHVQVCEELFSATRTEFKHLEYFYFHNCLYDHVWKDNRRRYTDPLDTWQVLHTYGHDYKVLFDGDASMSPYEIMMPGGSVEYWNEEAGEAWLKRVEPSIRTSSAQSGASQALDYTPSIGIIEKIFEERMFELTLDGLDRDAGAEPVAVGEAGTPKAAARPSLFPDFDASSGHAQSGSYPCARAAGSDPDRRLGLHGLWGGIVLQRGEAVRGGC